MIRKPKISGEYISIYKPSKDIFPGPDSYCFKAGQVYDDWIPNDFTVIKGPDNRWHMLGITHPSPPDFIPPFTYNLRTIHDGEWLLFHAVSRDGSLKENLLQGMWEDRPKVLYPAQRPGENFNIYAPHIVKNDETYYMFYSPNPIRYAVSKDLYIWEPKGELFSGHPSSRDPNLIFYNGRYLMTYVSKNCLLQRTSDDLFHWDEPREIFRMDRSGDPESPFIVQYENCFYLFWCIWDGENGPYDHRTFVYCSDNPYNFNKGDFITMIDAHAPEIIVDEDGDWYILSAEWPCRGVNIAPLKWE